MSCNKNVQETHKNTMIQSESINWVCLVCDCRYINKKEFFDHLCSKKNANIESVTELTFSIREELQDDSSENLGRPFKCQQCDLTFDRASQYDYHHRSIHLGEKSQLCEICGKGFFRKADLRTHLNTHLGTNVSICKICGKKFNHISNFIRHSRIHAGEKPYPCSVCGKRFNQISSWARHKRIHERVNENDRHQLQIIFDNCNLRDKDYAEDKNKFVKGNIPNQQKVVRRQYYCKICGEGFTFISLLREHEKSHSQSITTLEPKNIEMNFQKTIDLKEHKIHTINSDVLENETNLKRVLPLETIIYITSEQLKKIKLENMESSKTNASQGHLLELNEKVETTLPNTSVNVTNRFYKPDLLEFSANDLNIQKYQEINSVQNERSTGDTNDVNNITNYDESMSRLVQTESEFYEFMEQLDQFYEFLINYLIEKLPNIQSVKVSETKDEDTNISENDTNMRSNIKNVNEEVRQNIRDDTQSDISYTQYELQGDERNFVTNHNLLDPYAELDKYVETNFEVFERLNYDDSSERFLELVEITGVGNQNSKISSYKETEQFLQFHNFGQSDSLETNEKNNPINDNEHILLPSLKEDTQCEINVNSDQMIKKDETKSQSCNVNRESRKSENQQQKIKKSKEFIAKYQCKVCDKSFSTSYNYKQHIGTHFADQQTFHCKECKMSFAWKSTLNKHIASNHRPEGPQKFACDICKKVYSTSSQVNEHVKRDHLKQRNHFCSHCGKSFFKKYDLKIHNRIHTDERPYVCRACGKRFHHRSHIIRHERIHS